MTHKVGDTVSVADRPAEVTEINGQMVQVAFKSIEGTKDKQWFHESKVLAASPIDIGVGDGEGENPQK